MLAADGLIAPGSWRLLGGEVEPVPRDGERVLLMTHVERGFSLPHLAAFISMCENFLGCHPHWGLFKHIFTCRSQSMKKANPTNERIHVIQICGGLGVQIMGRSSFPPMIFPESVRGW